jgi:para-aminobenzoate synthetase component 1
MRHFSPVVAAPVPGGPTQPRPPAAPACAGMAGECARLEWRVDHGGDPAHLLEDFLAANGLPVRDLGASRRGRTRHRAGAVCGASVFVSAAAGARMVGFTGGAPTPVPAVPDLVAVVYRHHPIDAAPVPTYPPRPPVRAASPRVAGWQLGPWRDGWTAAEHAAAVQRARAAIARGDVYQVNLVGHASAPYVGDPLPPLWRLSALPGARYGGALTGADWAIASASPETLVEVSGGRVWTRPIKGTRPATEAGRRELLASAKERAEHVMIVDLERNDLARVARTGSVRVDELYALRRWCDLWQAESVVSATLVQGCGLADLLRAVCPGGSVTGAPKLAALAEIAALEPVGRGASMGALGWISAGRVDLGLTIRTAAVDADRLHVWAGGGITWGSDPQAEVAEAAAKARPLRAALEGPDPADRRPAAVTPGRPSPEERA